MVPGSARNWIAVKNNQQSSLNNKYDNSTLKKFEHPVAFAARFFPATATPTATATATPTAPIESSYNFQG
jgi:hypothetical protein